MQTSPCGHKVVCRRCFVKTIQSAVAQRMLPLRCVICRARINRLISNSRTWRLQESYSSYSMSSKSWSISTSGSNSIQPSASSYSFGRPKRVAQSSSLYSMSSGSSTLSGVSSTSNLSSQSTTSRTYSTLSNSSGHLNSGKSSTHVHEHSTCQKGCSGAIPRKPLNSINQSVQQVNSPTIECKISLMNSINTYPGRRTKSRILDLQKRLPPIKEFLSPAKVPHPSPVHINNPKFRYTTYTKSTPPNKDPSPSRKLGGPIKSGLSAKVSPAASKTVVQKNSLLLSSNEPSSNEKRTDLINPSSTKFQIFSDKDNNKQKIESVDKKKREEKKNKAKVEKEAKKEEKRIAKEEERLAKILAKEEKKKGRREGKEVLLAQGCGNKKLN